MSGSLEDKPSSAEDKISINTRAGAQRGTGGNRLRLQAGEWVASRCRGVFQMPIKRRSPLRPRECHAHAQQSLQQHALYEKPARVDVHGEGGTSLGRRQVE